MVSVVIPLYNDEKNIFRCLGALLDELHEEDEVIVVDNGSNDGSVDSVHRFQGLNLKLMSLKEGTVAAVRNFGAAQASSDIIAFIDSDCLVQPGWRNAFLRRFAGAAAVGATGSKYLVPADAPWFVQVWFSQRRPEGDVVYINSGNFIVKKEAFNAVGGFNEVLVTGEDAEICLRLRLAGYRIIEDQSVAVVHLGNPVSLADFYQQQKWHSLGMLGTVRWGNLDKPFLMTVAFGAAVLLAALLFLIKGFNLLTILTGGLLVTLVPLLSSLYRCWQCKTLANLPFFCFLYMLYFIARIRVLLTLLSRTKSIPKRQGRRS